MFQGSFQELYIKARKHTMKMEIVSTAFIYLFSIFLFLKEQGFIEIKIIYWLMEPAWFRRVWKEKKNLSP